MPFKHLPGSKIVAAMSGIAENNVNSYVAGLRQLLESIEPIIRQASSPATVEEILLNLESTDENFHKYDLVRMLRERIEDDLGPLIETIANDRGVNETDDAFATSEVDEVLNSVAYSKVSIETMSTIKEAANEIIKSMVENGGSFPMTFSSPDKYSRFPNRSQDSHEWDSYLTSSFDGDDFMFMSPNKYNTLAHQLLPESSLSKRLEALHTLSQVPQTDLVNSEFWVVIKKGLSHALKDSNHILAEKSLKFHAKMFATASGHVTKEIYTSLTDHLIDYFNDSTSHMVSIDSGLDLGDRRNIKLLKEFRLLNQFQHDLPLYWVRYPEKLVEEILQSTTNLMAVIPQPMSSNIVDTLITPYNFLSLIDPSAFWFCKWMHGNYSRAELLKHLHSNDKIILKEACRSCSDFLLHVKAKMSTTLDDDFGSENLSETESLVYSKAEILCMNFIQSLSILGRVILYKKGRDLFPIELDDGFETITVTDLVVMFVEVISLLPLSASSNHNLDNLEPTTMVTNILKNVSTASSDTCLSCVCKDAVTNALLQPVQKYLDGYVSVEEAEEKYEMVLTSVAEILAVIASTYHGRYQLLYGEKQERWQRSRLAPVYTIALFTKKALSGTLKVQPSENVVCAFLFVCRQLYNSCEGMMIMNSFNLSDCISKALEKIRDGIPLDNPRNSKNAILPMNEASSASKTLFSTNALQLDVHDTTVTEYKSEPRLNEFRSRSGSTNSEIVTEEDLFGTSMAEHENLQKHDCPSTKLSESLIDNLLSFASTPKGKGLIS